MTDNAVSGFSHLPESQSFLFFLFHNCTSHSDLDICRPWILIVFFFQKVWVFCGDLGVTGVWGSSVWYVWMAWLKNSREGLLRYYSPVFVEFLFLVCQFASFFDASSKFSTRSGGQNVVKHHTWKTQFFLMCSNVNVKANSSLMIYQKTNHVWWSLWINPIWFVNKTASTMLAYRVNDQYLEHHRPLPQCPLPLEPCFRELWKKG